MIDFGIVRPGQTLYIPFSTYDSNDPSASVTLTGLATTDIEIYKNGSVTQRSSDSGYALLDTDGIDFDGITGIHGFSIDLADNTDAGFYAAGAQYWVIVASVTVDAATINFRAATFRIGYPSAILNTTIATLASQTSFTLTSGPAEDDALNGMEVIIHDVASAVQLGRAVISDYTGSTKTVTLAAGTTFTAAATDNISIMGPSPLMPSVAGATTVVQTGDSYARIGANGGSLSAVPWNASWDAEVQSEVADALDAALPGSPTAGSANDVLKDLDARLPAAGTLAVATDIPSATTNADALLKRDMSAVSGEADRSPINALRFLRNKWTNSAGTLTVYKENDTDSAWTAATTTAASDPVDSVDPA